jgi:hypothetical protein
MLLYTFKHIFKNTNTWKYVSHFWTSTKKYNENIIIIGFFILQMDEALICINVF